MTFGTEWGWGCDRDTARALFDRHLEAGGNFIDTADGYTNGTSEQLVGEFIRDTRSRDRVVLATKFTFNAEPGNPNAGGNGRKNIYRALEGSLRRLGTDYVDLYWLHAWDGLTPVEEVIATLDTLVRQGKVRYIGLSDTPAWYFARAQTLATLRGYEPVCALQLEYSLVERSIEREHIPAALEMGASVCAWSPLASGLLTGKYAPAAEGSTGQGRLATQATAAPNPVFHKFNERNWKIVASLLPIAKQLDHSPAQIAVNWVARRPGVSSTILGATKLAQLEDTLGALEFELPADAVRTLDEASAVDVGFPYLFFEPQMRNYMSGGVTVRARWRR